MNHLQAIHAGLQGAKLSRTITGTSEVSAGRLVVAAASGAALGSASVGAVTVGATAVGATALAAAAAPVLMPVVVVAGVFGLISNWFG